MPRLVLKRSSPLAPEPNFSKITAAAVMGLLEERGSRGLTPREGGKVLHCDGMAITNVVKSLGDVVVTRGWSPVSKDDTCIQEARYYLRESAPGGTPS